MGAKHLMSLYAFVLGGEVLEVRTYASPPACKHIDGLPTIRPLVEDLTVPAGHRITGTTYAVHDDQVVRTYTTEAIPLEELRNAKLAEIRGEGAARLEAISAEYTPEERDTWAQQAREADSFDGTNATAPMLAEMASRRGFTTQEMVNRVNAARAAFTLAGGAILGAQQALEDAARAAADAAALAAIDPLDPTNWPEL